MAQLAEHRSFEKTNGMREFFGRATLDGGSHGAC